MHDDVIRVRSTLYLAIGFVVFVIGATAVYYSFANYMLWLRIFGLIIGGLGMPMLALGVAGFARLSAESSEEEKHLP